MNDIHVSVTGSDETGLGTPSAPVRSIGKALAAFSHGNRILVQPGEYVEAAPLVVRSIEQGRIVSPEHGGAVVRVADGVTAPAVLSLLDCTHCVVDGITFRNHPEGRADGGAVRVVGGRGNLLRNVAVRWTASTLAPAAVLSLIEIASSNDCRVLGLDVSETAIAGSGIVVLVRVTNADIELEDCAVTAAVTGSAIARGVLLEATTARTARLRRIRIVDLETWNAIGSPPDCIGIRVDVAGSGSVTLVARDLLIARPRALGLVGPSLTSTKGSGMRVACQESVDVDGAIFYGCGVGYDGVNVPNPSRLDRITAHQCGSAIRSVAPAPPSRYVVRNVSFSGCDIGLEALGRPGETFFDVDFVNFHDTQHWFTAADPVASSFELGGHITEFHPMYADPEALDFSISNVSGLVNRGGDL